MSVVTIEYTATVAVIFIAAGLIITFFGARLFKFMLLLFGFLIGYGGTFYVCLHLLELTQTWSILTSMVGGLLGVALTLYVFKLGLFMTGAALGYLLGRFILVSQSAAFDTLAEKVICVTLCVLVAGILGVLLEKPFLILSTATLGSYGFISGTYHFAKHSVDPYQLFIHPRELFLCTDAECVALVVVFAVLAVAGVFVQARILPRKDDDDDDLARYHPLLGGRSRQTSRSSSMA
eukprot:GFYU01003731.1.p1 GENE.GFYU01003731.1~~GFYU01003731.1.p1  ORF type:complete len:235 (+),score=40.56 GFYU01003731.1:137-841(+)